MTPLALGIMTTVAVVCLAIVVSLLMDAWTGTGGIATVVRAVSISAAAWVGWLVIVVLTRPELSGVPAAVAGAMAGLAAVLICTTARIQGLTPVRSLVLAVVFVVGVFSPIAISLFSLDTGLLGADLATLDLAGALPVLVAAGGGSAAILVLSRRSGSPTEFSSAKPAILLPVLLVVWVLWVLWMVGLESAIDDATPRIVVSGIVAPLVSALVWLIVQRVIHARTTTVGIVGGLFCGMASIAPAAAYLDLVGAALTGGIAGAVCSLTGYALMKRTGRPAWMLAVVLSLGSGLGTGLLGAFATRSGLMFTGQPEVLFTQFISVLLVLGWSFLVTGIGWVAVTRGARSQNPRPSSRATDPVS